ncbi:MAG: hypothetical protein HN936_02670 [Bacteroidetes bacterium]|nr:hypothetical protein [Bacteroidota bacterium]
MSNDEEKAQTTVGDIEEWLEVLFESEGLVLSEHRIEDSEQKSWAIGTGHEQIYAVLIINDTDPTMIFLEIDSILGEMPQNNLLPFYRKCLELNYSLFNGSITLLGAQVWYVQQQYIENINESKLASMFAEQLSNTEKLYEVLSNEFDML